jgi:transposase
MCDRFERCWQKTDMALAVRRKMVAEVMAGTASVAVPCLRAYPNNTTPDAPDIGEGSRHGVAREVLYDNMRTVVTDRDRYGPGVHRYNRAFLDFVHHYGFLPRLCWPYRPKTKGKVERFIGYLRASFYVPLASQLSPEKLKVDRDTANARVGTWLREVADARVHATTGEVPPVRLELERERLQPIPRPWPGTIQRKRVPHQTPPPRGYQHSLKVYEALLSTEVR